jgi:glycosyltransferase involved in cell wall biosynthesis
VSAPGERPERVPIALVVGGLGQGGAERQLHYLATGLAGSRVAPVVFCLSEQLLPYGPRLEAAGVPVVPLRRHGHFDVRRAVDLGSQIRRRRIRLVHAFLLDASVYAALACRWGGRPALVTSNRVCLPGRSRLRRTLDGWALRGSDAVVVNSDEVGRFTRRQYGVPVGRLRRIYNGIDPRPFIAAARDGGIRRELGAGERDRLVVTIARMEPQKNPGMFLEVAASVAGADPLARFAWVGDGSEAGWVSERIRQLGLEDRVRCAGGRSDIPEVLAASDLFVLTSDAEGLPNVVLEAMAAGLGVVATDLGGTREALGDTGLLRAPGDAPAFAQAVRSLLADPAARRDLGGRARARVLAEFPLDRMVRETEHVYLECLDRRGRDADRRAA